MNKDLKKYVSLKAKVAKLYEKIDLIRKAEIEPLRKQLAVDCKHPIEHIIEFNWEFDDGYGRQKWNKGKRCTICNSEKHYEMSYNWVKPEHLRRD